MNSVVLNKESARLSTLRQYQILDTSPEEAFDDLAMLAAQICDTPIALINLIDADRQWFKAKVGIDWTEVPREIGFCSICIEADDILIIPDTLASEKFATSSVVIAEPYVRFYAGVPLTTPQGLALGTLCVVDTKPKQITQKQVDSLKSIARLVMRQLEVRRNINQLVDIQSDYKEAKEALHQSEHILSSFFNSAAMMMGVVEIYENDIKLISGNVASANFLRVLPRELQNCRASQIGLSQEYIKKWIGYYRKAERIKAPVRFEYIHESSGNVKVFNVTVTAIDTYSDDTSINEDKNKKFAYIIEDITERKQAEEERLKLLELDRTATNRIKNIFESITDGFFALDNNWCFSYLNKQAEPLLQRQREELLGHNIWEAFPDAVNSKFYHQYHHAVAERVSVEFEEFYPPLNTWFAVHAYPSKDGLSVYFQDITKRKQAEEELNCQQAIMRSINSVSPLGYYVVNKCSGQVFFLNNRFCEIWGIEHLQQKIEHYQLKNKDIITECLKLVVDVPAFVEADKLIHNQNKLSVSEDEILLKDGRVIRRVSTRFRQEGDCCAGRLYIFEDITERKRTEQQMRSSAALLDVTSDAIVLRDLSNKILLWNKGAEKLYGWQAEEVINNNNANDVLSCVKSPQYKDIYNTVLEKGCWQGELVKPTKSGQEIIVDSCWTLVLDEHQEPKSILTVDTDITQKKQLEAQFLRAQRVESIGTLASGIAHDLNNVLSPILMSAQLLNNKSNNLRDSQILSIIENNAKRGADLVKQVLSFARGMEGEHTKIQLQDLIKEIKQIVEQTFPKSIDFYTDIKPNLQVIIGDNTQLHQVLINLCLNARDAMPEGGKLTLSAENILIDENFQSMHIDAKVGQYILLTLTDTGIGIDRQNLDRIFEPFFTTKEFGKGTGLGLSTVMGIIKGHGGFVNVSSTVGKGTQFKVYLPAVNSQIISNNSYTKIPHGNGELVLVVDDEPSIREITKTSLESYNYEVMTASDGIEAVAIFAQYKNKIKAAIIDMMMPNMDGSTTISTLLRMNPLLPIVAVSGLATSEQVNIDKNSQIFAFLPKPYTAQELLNCVYKVLYSF
ncbi:PAS domain S-box protein [Dulcicalothrix desertica]|nr:PAS domain S-box protein [Dulcicalothrix desertica]TWH54578.1 PAS domain S-box-containing protein [Dulcicalothrix desertica PCC 7102]